jgi:hypothetical protein
MRRWTAHFWQALVTLGESGYPCSTFIPTRDGGSLHGLWVAASDDTSVRVAFDAIVGREWAGLPDDTRP